MQHILIVDDEVDFARGLSRLIAQGFPEQPVAMVHNGSAALEYVEDHPVSIMLLDLNMPGMHGLDVLAEMRRREAQVAIIVLTAYGTVETAVSALKQGAWDFLTKPVEREELLRCLGKALEHYKVLDENRRLKDIMASTGMEKTLVGDSEPMRRLREGIAAVAASSYTVLIRGESGTGKELVAEAVHDLSTRRDGPFIKVNCPAIPEQLLESELFGHAKGAFTGAASAHKGLFVQAEGGTLLLDEVGDIPPGIQVKLLRALQNGEVRPVGSNKATRIDTRIIAATNQDLESKIKLGEFREDLFYRLNVLTLNVPPLRDRKEDIPLLAALFFAQSCEETGQPEKQLSPEAVAALALHDWPGNVRELQNYVRRQAVFACTGDAGAQSVFFEPGADREGAEHLQSYKDAKNNLVESFTKNYMKEILNRTRGNISEAARISGLERVSLQKIMRRLGMTREDFLK